MTPPSGRSAPPAVPAEAPDSAAGSVSTPAGRSYWDPSIYEIELDRCFYRNWLCVGREEQLSKPGDFRTRAVGREQILLVRDTDGTLRGFYNLCRHRGSRVVVPAEGTGARSFICPYHAWSYGLDGRLVGAPHMDGQPGFERAESGLHPIRVATWGGFVWANLEPGGETLAAALAPFFGRFDRLPLADLRLGGRREYEVEANWKILVENFSECYHCAPVHPALNRLTPYLSGANDARFLGPSGPGRFAGGYMEFAGDFQSMTRTGYTRRPRIPGTTAEDRRRVYYYVVFPNLFFSLHPDYLMVHRCWPTSPTHSRIENEFYFPPQAMDDPTFDPTDAIDLWDEINRQDWEVCALAQQGMRSRAWSGGRYSDKEPLVRDFDAFVAHELARPDPPHSPGNDVA